MYQKASLRDKDLVYQGWSSSLHKGYVVIVIPSLSCCLFDNFVYICRRLIIFNLIRGKHGLPQNKSWSRHHNAACIVIAILQHSAKVHGILSSSKKKYEVPRNCQIPRQTYLSNRLVPGGGLYENVSVGCKCLFAPTS